MPNSIDDVNRLLADAELLEDGPVKVAMIDEAVRIADSHNDDDAAFRARFDLIQASSFAGQPDIMLVAFSWCLSRFDADPERFETTGDIEFHLLWRYKWVVGQLPEFPQFSKVQIRDMLADMRSRHRAWGSTLHAFYDESESIAMTMGDKESAVEAHKKFVKAKRDSLSNCPACVQDQLIRYHAFCGRFEQAVAASEPILSRKLTCNSVPHRTYSRLLNILFKLKQVEKAMEYHKIGYRMVARKPGMIGNVGDHIRFMTLTDNLDRAAKMLDRHLPVALESTCPDTRHEFLREARLLLHRLLQAGRKTITLRLPAGHPCQTPTGKVEVGTIYHWVEQECQQVAKAFDTRNENTRYQDELATDLTIPVQPLKYER